MFMLKIGNRFIASHRIVRFSMTRDLCMGDVSPLLFVFFEDGTHSYYRDREAEALFHFLSNEDWWREWPPRSSTDKRLFFDVLAEYEKVQPAPKAAKPKSKPKPKVSRQPRPQGGA